MSFGYSVGDVLAVGQLCWKVYKKCKDSPGNYKELASEVGALHNVVKETEELLSQQALTSKQENKLFTCRQGCESVLKDLDGLLVKYESLGTNARRTFDRMGFGMQDMNGIRLRLISNTSLLDAFNNLSSQARLENKMNILIAEVRAGKREGSVISTKTFDATAQIDRDTWEALRRDLEDVGVSQDIITEKREFIITWFQEAVAAGKLEEDPPSDDEADGDDVLERTIDLRRNPAKGQPLKGERKSRTRISYLFDKLGWKSDWQSKQLLEAAIAGDVSRVIYSLEKGVDIEYKDKKERTALALAANKGNEPVARLLLERGANPESKDSRGDTALILAAFLGHISIIELLLENGADIESSGMNGETSLFIAARKGYESAVRVLLEKGANTESTNRNRETPLNHAAGYGHKSVVRLLLEKGANMECMNADNETPLIRAAQYGYVSVVQALLEKGANIEARYVSGETPLMIAARAGHVPVAQALLEKGANIEARYVSGETPLMIAARAGHVPVLQTLLEKGANIETRCVSGKTPLMIAARAGHVPVVQVLLDKGVNVHARDIDGKNALYHAKENERVLQLLRSAGAEAGVRA